MKTFLSMCFLIFLLIQIYKETGLFTCIGFVIIFIYGFCLEKLWAKQIKLNKSFNNALMVYGEEIKRIQKALNDAISKAKDFFVNMN